MVAAQTRERIDVGEPAVAAVRQAIQCVKGLRSRGPARVRPPLAFHRSEEAIAAPLQGLNESWGIGGIPERRPQFADAVVQALVEVDEGVIPPERLFQFLTRHHFAGTNQQHAEDSQRLRTQRNDASALAQLRRPGSNSKTPKRQRPPCPARCVFTHC